MAHFVANIQPSLSEISHHETTTHHQGHRPAHQQHQGKQHHHSHPPHSSSQLFQQSRSEYNKSDGNTAFLRAARAGHLDKVLEQLKNNVDINTCNANGLNALHLASKDGHINVVSELLKRGANVDAATKKGNTALHIASLAGQEEVVKHLVEHGACVNVQSQNGFTPLYMAAQENHDAVVRFLLANGANQSLATEDGFTPLAVAMQQGHDKVVAVLLENDTRGKVRLPALHIAAKKDDCKAAALLLQNEHNPDVTSKSGFTPLHIASHYGNEGIASLLLSKGADVNYAAKHNITPLHVAAKWGKANMVSTLLSRGANIEAKTRDGLTPLHCAARSGHEQVVDMLLERGAPISAKTKNGLAALHMSSQGDHVDAARILLYHRAPVDDVTVDYLTALHVAAHCGHVGVARLLLDRKADPNARALNGFTPLHIACKKNRIKVVELLLKHGASIEATTESGLTPLHVASFMGCMNIVIYLVQNEAHPDVKTVRGETPLHLAARANQTDIIRILLRNGAQVDARAREQQTPLHIASRLGNVDIVMLLLQHGASVDSTTKDLYTALHIAAKEGQDEVASVLLENGASLEATTKKGFTPLHLAAKYGHMNVAKLLLRREAPVDAQGKNGVTPLHVASHYDHQNVALLLLEKGASPHATAKNGHTPLHIAARKNQMDIATTLLEYGAKANAESKAGFTPLHLSAQEGHADMSSLLIEHQADINHKAKNGLTPLHLCAQEDRVEVGTILLKNNAQVDSTTKAGYTPLHVASHFGQMAMVRLLLSHGANVTPTTAVNYTPLHQAAQQGHSGIVNALLDAGANPNATTNQGQTALSIAQKLGYISVVESLKGVTDTPISPTSTDEKYKVVAPETMQETFMSDSEDEGDVLGLEYGFTPAHPHVYLPFFQGDSIFTREDTMLSEQPYHYLTVDEMKGLGDDSLPIDVTRDERDNRDFGPPTAIDDTISPQHMKESYSQFTSDNVDIAKHPLHIGFLVSFLVDARGGAMRGCRHSGVRVIVPPRRAPMPLRVTCRYLKRDKLPHPPPLMEGEALASRILELGPVGAKFLGPVMIEVPHFGSLRGKEREIVILRSDNGETWREHTFEPSEEAIHDVLSHSFEKDEISQVDESGRTTRILTTEFPHYIAVVSRVRQEVHAIGPEGGMVSSTVVPQVQAVFPHGALTKKIKVGLQAQPIPTELTAKLLGNRVAVSPIVTVEPRRRKFHKPISLTIPVPQAANKGMINQYSGDAPTLRLLCSITGGTTRAQWEDVTGSTPLTFVNDCVSFTTTVSARFWLMDCRNITEATKMATELYREAIHVPFMAKFVVFAKRVDTTEARLRVFCMTDDKEDKTLEHQEHFTEVAKSRDVEVLEGKMQYLEFAGNLTPVTKSGEQLQLAFRAFKENRLPFTARVKDPHADAIGRIIFMREPKVAKGDVPQQPICILNIVLPEDIIPDSDLHDHDTPKHSYITHTSGLQRLSDISNLLGEDWPKLATELDISTSEINSIKTELRDLSEAQQGFAMLRLWLQNSGNKATASTLEEGLRNIDRNDIIQQTVFSTDLTDPYVLSEDLSPSYTTRHNIFRKTMTIEKEIITADKRKEKEAIDKHDRDEKKYVAEEKEVEEEVHKSVSERKKEIEKRLSQDMDKKEPKDTKTVVKSEKKHLEEKSEKEIAEEKAVSPEPAHLSFDEKRKSFEMGITPKETLKQETQKLIKEEITQEVVHREKSVEKTEESLSFKEKRLSFEQGLSMKKPGDKLPEKKKPEDIKADEKRLSDYRRDSELFEEVSQGLGRLEKGFEKPQPKDLLSPMVVKTPPPSPAEFSKETPDNKKWSSDAPSNLLSGEGERQKTEPTKETIDTKTILRDEEKAEVEEKIVEDKLTVTEVDVDSEESGYDQHDDPLVTTPTQTRRNTGIGGSQRLPQGERPTVRVVTDYLEDAYESDPEESYTVTEPYERPQRSMKIRFSPDLYEDEPEEKRKVEKVEKCFQRMASKEDPKESVQVEGEFEKMVSQMSTEEVDQALHQWDAGGLTPSDIDSKEITVSSEESPSQQESSHTPEREESGEPPVPPPRVPIQESEIPKEPIEETQNYASKKMFWEQISGGSADLEEPVPVPKPRMSLTSSTASELKNYSDASRKLEASEIDESSPIHGTTTTKKVLAGFTKEYSMSQDGDSEMEYIKAHDKEELSYDNSAFSLEEEAKPKKPIYERSVSLPCDSSLEGSSVRAKKRVFEAQIKKEMVVEQLMSQLEEESSPEHKSIEQKDKMPATNPQAMVSRQIHSDIFSKELEEQIEFVPENKEIVEKFSRNSSIDTTDLESDYDTKLSKNVKEVLQYKTEITKPSDSLEVHVDKSELEDTEKEIEEEIRNLKETGLQMPQNVEKVKVSSLTSSQGESEDTFSESDVTPEDARFKENHEISEWEKEGKLNVEEDTKRQRNVYTPEEHIPDTVWEVPVQEEVERMEEETVQFPTVAQDKGILISPKPISESEARQVAENVVEDIEEKLYKNEVKEIRKSIDLNEISKKDIRSAFVRTDTTTSSMEITDEDLRSSGVETDNSPLESQAGRLGPLDEDSGDDVDNHEFDQEVVDKTLAEVKLSLEAAKEELIEEKKKKKDSITKESPSEFQFKAVSLENNFSEAIQEGEDTRQKLETTNELTKEDFSSLESRSSKDSADDPSTVKSYKEFNENLEKKTETVTVEDKSKVSMMTSDSFTDLPKVDVESTKDIEVKPDFIQEDAGSTSSSSEPKFGMDTLPRKHKRTHLSTKVDAKSDSEVYSSSGESHYQSFEQTSESIKTPGSRPLSSDIEGLVANISGVTGSSEYDTAVSHETSTAATSQFHTAVSSLSSRDSMKSLDSESSGNLASVEVSSEASETLVPSAMELDKDIEEDDVKFEKRHLEEQFKASFSESIQSVSFDVSTEDMSEDDVIMDQEMSARMKRSHEMTFQPEPRPILAEMDTKSFEDKYASSLDDANSLISSTDTAALHTVVELSKTESERMDGSATSDQLSLTVSGTSLSFSESKDQDEEQVTKLETVSTQSPSMKQEVESVTMTTSSVQEHGIQSVCTQVTSKTTHSNGPTKVEYVSEYMEQYVEPEVKKKGHRRNGSTASFKPSMIPVFHTRQVEKKKSDEIAEDTAESDKYKESLTIKEGSHEEKKDIDEAERMDEEFYQTEADQGLNRDIREGRVILEDTYGLEIKDDDYDSSLSVKSRLPSSAYSDDRADSELADILKSSTDIITEDPIERPRTPEPIEECEIKDDTPEFSSEAQASVTELEMEYSGAFSRTSEYEAHISPIREKGAMGESWECTERESESEVVFHSGSITRKTDDSISEKHELETQELKLKDEPDDRRSSPVPDIQVTKPTKVTESFENLEGPLTPLPSSAIPSSGKSFNFSLDNQEMLADETFPSEDSRSDLRQESKEESVTDSPTSDSFELLEKPDLADEFVIIEEVGKEAEEQDTEGKGMAISQARTMARHHKQDDEIIVSPPTTATKLTKVKYYGGANEEDALFDFDSGSPSKKGESSEEKADSSSVEGSPPIVVDQDFKPEVEAGKKWIEMQFQGTEPIAPIFGMDGFERGPLEDIKEEDINDFESSSKIGSMGSQVSHSIGSFGSVKESLSSTPDYDILAGRKFFTRSGDHDDVSMSSLQEFERLENLIALESSKHRSSGSQDSLTSSSNNSRKHPKSAAGDDISLSSLKEFEGLESACIAAERIEIRAKAEEEFLLSEIEEGHESQASESESCETISVGITRAESDEDDYERRMFEIDEIIRQAQTNVEQFMGHQKELFEGGNKCETLGRADSIEEISKVPDLDLDQPVSSYSGGKSYIQHWEEDLVTSTDSLEIKTQVSKTSYADPFTTSSDSLEVKMTHDIMSVSTDSIEASQKSKKKDIMTDSIEIEKSYNVTSTDSLEGKVTQANSIDEEEQHLCADQSSSSGKEGDFSSSGKEDSAEGAVGTNRMPPPRAEFLLGSTDSLEPTSSTATHATYHYETDSVMSSSFTSGDSTTMVDDNEEDAARAAYWFEEGKPYVTEVIEPISETEFQHMIHRKVEMPPEIHKVTFKGEGAEKNLREYIEKFDPGEDVTETREVDKDGNVHIKRVIQKRVVLRPEEFGETSDLKGSDVHKYIQSMKDPIGSSSLPESSQYSSPIESQTSITTIQRTTTSTTKGETVISEQQPTETEVPRRGSRPPLKYDISVDEEPEYDPREHDWRFDLHTHLEGEEEDEGFGTFTA